MVDGKIMHVSFFMHFFSVSFFLNRNSVIIWGAVERSELPFCRLPLTPSIHLSLFPSPYTMICLLPPPPKFPLIFLVSKVPLSVSYRCGASVGGVAWVFQVLLDAVVDLQEVVVPLRGVIGGCRGARLALGQRVHRQLGGGQRPEGLQPHRWCLAGVRGICGAGRRAWAASITVAVAGDARDGRTLEVVGGSCPHAQLPMAVDEHVHGQHAHHFGHDEGEGAEVEGPAVGVAVLLGVTLGRVPSVGWYVDNDSYDVAQAWDRERGSEIRSNLKYGQTITQVGPHTKQPKSSQLLSLSAEKIQC